MVKLKWITFFLWASLFSGFHCLHNNREWIYLFLLNLKPFHVSRLSLWHSPRRRLQNVKADERSGVFKYKPLRCCVCNRRAAPPKPPSSYRNVSHLRTNGKPIYLWAALTFSVLFNHVGMSLPSKGGEDWIIPCGYLATSKYCTANHHSIPNVRNCTCAIMVVRLRAASVNDLGRRRARSLDVTLSSSATREMMSSRIANIVIRPGVAGQL